MCLSATGSKERGDVEGVTGKKTPGSAGDNVGCEKSLGGGGRAVCEFA